MAHISRDADAKCEAILKAAEAKRAEALKAANAKAQETEARILARGHEEAKVALQRVVGSAKMQAHREELKLKEQLLNDVFARAAEKLERLPAEEYEKALAGLLVSDSGLADFTVVVNKESKASAAKAAKSHAIVVEEIPKGLVLRSKDGKVEIDQTFAARLARMRDELRIEAAGVLFK